MSPNEPKNPGVLHVFDDIEEQDNHLPNWWLAILFGSIVFGFGYWIVYHTAHWALGPEEEFQVYADARRAKEAAAKPVEGDDLLALSKDEKALAAGKESFVATCVACHGPNGEGLVGPNLTDNKWIHGASPAVIAESISKGFPEKGMPPWGATLGPERVKNLTAYVLSLKGKNLPGKAPEGDIVE